MSRYFIDKKAIVEDQRNRLIKYDIKNNGHILMNGMKVFTPEMALILLPDLLLENGKKINGASRFLPLFRKGYEKGVDDFEKFYEIKSGEDLKILEPKAKEWIWIRMKYPDILPGNVENFGYYSALLDQCEKQTIIYPGVVDSESSKKEYELIDLFIDEAEGYEFIPKLKKRYTGELISRIAEVLFALDHKKIISLKTGISNKQLYKIINKEFTPPRGSVHYLASLLNDLSYNISKEQLKRIQEIDNLLA